MTQRILNYDKTRLGQDTGWYCGPATTQTILSGHGQFFEERTLAAEIEQLENPGRGDDRDGTDYIGLVETVLERRLGVPYRSIELRSYPNRAQIDQLFAHIRQSIDGGYGVAVNWVAPPSNRPRGVLGSQSPSYPANQTIFHYVAIMGYDDAARAVWVADSGFWPREYWLALDQLASLIVPKGYAYADVQPSANNPPVPVNTGTDAVRTLSNAMGGRLSLERYAQLLPAVRASLAACECGTVERIAMWCAQIGHESGGLYYTEEIASGAAYEGRRDLGNTQPGDGVRFKGRSWIQITGRSNYTQLSQWAFTKRLVPTPTWFVDNPVLLKSDDYAGLGAAWYWVVARPDIDRLSDARDLVTVTRRINGGTNGLEDRRTRYGRALQMGSELLNLTEDWTPVMNEIMGIA